MIVRGRYDAILYHMVAPKLCTFFIEVYTKRVDSGQRIFRLPGKHLTLSTLSPCTAK